MVYSNQATNNHQAPYGFFPGSSQSQDAPPNQSVPPAISTSYTPYGGFNPSMPPFSPTAHGPPGQQPPRLDTRASYDNRHYVPSNWKQPPTPQSLYSPTPNFQSQHPQPSSYLHAATASTQFAPAGSPTIPSHAGNVRILRPSAPTESTPMHYYQSPSILQGLQSTPPAPPGIHSTYPGTNFTPASGPGPPSSLSQQPVTVAHHMPITGTNAFFSRWPENSPNQGLFNVNLGAADITNFSPQLSNNHPTLLGHQAINHVGTDFAPQSSAPEPSSASPMAASFAQSCTTPTFSTNTFSGSMGLGLAPSLPSAPSSSLDITPGNPPQELRTTAAPSPLPMRSMPNPSTEPHYPSISPSVASSLGPTPLPTAPVRPKPGDTNGANRSCTPRKTKPSPTSAPASQSHRVKRPMNAFLLFSAKRRPQLQQADPPISTADQSKLLAEEWHGMSPTSKQRYFDHAKQLKEQFIQDHPDYVYTRRPNNARRATAVGTTKRGADDPAPVAETAPKRLKRPMNAYLLFNKEMRHQLLKDNPNMSVSQISKSIGDQWRSMSDAAKAPYLAQAQEIKDEFMSKNPNY
ncbi:hypothetical protein H4R35_006659, partial [Dimargaris xerosporica]